MRRTLWLFPLLLVGSGLLISRHLAARGGSPQQTGRELRLFETPAPESGHGIAAHKMLGLKVIPGTEQEAKEYYIEIRKLMPSFPQPTLAESRIGDMLNYFGFPALLATDLERLDPGDLMDFERLRRAVSNRPEFEAAYSGQPLRPGEILSTRFFAPKIINVRDPQVNGVPKGGFGWRKVLRFRSREGSRARRDGLDTFLLLFNFTSQDPRFPQNEHAGQIQSMLIPDYRNRGSHRDAYFLVYLGLGKPDPGKVGFFLEATFDLAGVVPDDRYYVPRSCGQCHGTVANDQKGAKVNYLDTDHWIDRTGDDFQRVRKEDVLVDGQGSFPTFRQLNNEIRQQNAAVVPSTDFALLAADKWLELHRNNDQHIDPLDRGFGNLPWNGQSEVDKSLLPLLNRYCFRCHSSIKYHVFQREAVLRRKNSIITRLDSTTPGFLMPLDRKLDSGEKQKIRDLMRKLQ